MSGSLKEVKILIILYILFSFVHTSVFSEPLKVNSIQPKTSALKRPDPMEHYRSIHSPEGFPDLPTFPGHTKFVGGYYSPDQSGITMCQMRYFAKEDPQSVIDFYKDAFSTNGWQILHTAGTHLTARHKDGHMCSVNINESKLPQTKSQFTIAYREVIKRR